MKRLVLSFSDRPYLLLSLTSLFWAGNSVVGRAVVHDIPPIALAQFRWTVAFLILLPFTRDQIRADWPRIRERLGLVVLMSLVGIAAFNTILYWSLQYTTAINATLMQSSGPLLIGLWSFALFRDPLTRGQIAGVAVSLLGVAAIVSGGSVETLAHLRLNAGDIAVLFAMLCYTLYSTLLRLRPSVAPLSFVTVTIGLGALLLAPVTIFEMAAGARFAPLTPGSVAVMLYVVLFPSILATLFFNRGIELIGANRAGPFFHLIPLFGALLAIVFLGERPGLHHGVGAALIIGGVLLASGGAGFGGKKRMAAGAKSA